MISLLISPYSSAIGSRDLESGKLAASTEMFKVGKNVEARLVMGYCPSLSPLLSCENIYISILGHKSNVLRDMKESLRNAAK